MPTIKGTLTRNVDGNLEYIYPRTSADMIEVDGERTIFDILNENNINIENLKNILGIEIYNFDPNKPYESNSIVIFDNKLYKFKENSSGDPDDNKWEEINILDLLSMVSRHLKAMKGATATNDGSVGYVNSIPPKDGFDTKFLRADGTWAVPVNTSEWNLNTVDQAGYVAAPTRDNANKVWKTDSEGNPDWRDDSDYGLQDLIGLTAIGSSTRPIYYDGLSFKASEYTIEKSVPADAKFTDTWRGIQNNLESDSVEESLSAAQGKILNEKFNDYITKDVVGDLSELSTDDTSSIVNAINSINYNIVTPMPPDGGSSAVDIVDNLLSSSTTKALSANQGRVLNEKFKDYIIKNDVIDNVESLDTNKPLSANQGRIINERFNNYLTKNEVLTPNDIINDLDTDSANKPLSAAQGKLLNNKFNNYITTEAIGDLSELTTPSRENLVDAINSVVVTGAGLTTGDVIDNLDSSYVNKPLSAYQGRVLNEKIINSPAFNVVNTLTSSSVDMPLSANQGRILNNKFSNYASIGLTGNLSELNTYDTTSLVSAINELYSGKLSSSNVINTLNSTYTDQPLSANQGRVLNEKINNVNNVTSLYTSDDFNAYRVGDIVYISAFNMQYSKFSSLESMISYLNPSHLVSIPCIINKSNGLYSGFIWYDFNKWQSAYISGTSSLTPDSSCKIYFHNSYRIQK